VTALRELVSLEGDEDGILHLVPAPGVSWAWIIEVAEGLADPSAQERCRDRVVLHPPFEGSPDGSLRRLPFEEDIEHDELWWLEKKGYIREEERQEEEEVWRSH